MLDGHYKGQKAGSGTIIWEARKLYSKGEIDYDQFMDMATASSPSVGHCNTMGTASTMNSIAIEFIVDAVPIVLQCPTLGEDAVAISIN